MRAATEKAVVTIYTRPGCHLCDEAKANILAADCRDLFIVEDVNIESDRRLTEKHGVDIPVVMINGTKVFKHRVDTREFERKVRRFVLR